MNPNLIATCLAVDDFPEADGPSMAIWNGLFILIVDNERSNVCLIIVNGMSESLSSQLNVRISSVYPSRVFGIPPFIPLNPFPFSNEFPFPFEIFLFGGFFIFSFYYSKNDKRMET